MRSLWSLSKPKFVPALCFCKKNSRTRTTRPAEIKIFRAETLKMFFLEIDLNQVLLANTITLRICFLKIKRISSKFSFEIMAF